jgi:hypothetical protein
VHILLFADPTPVPVSPTDTSLVNATWASFWAQTALAIITLALLAVGGWTLLRERQRDRELRAKEAAEREDARAGQARLVLPGVEGEVLDDGVVIVTFKVWNNSDRNIHLEAVQLGSNTEGALRTTSWAPIAPGDLFTFTKEFADPSWLKVYADVPPTVVFLDAAGLRWERVGRSDPTRVLDRQAYVDARHAQQGEAGYPVHVTVA